MALSTDAGWAPHVQVESLQWSLCGRERGGVRGGALPPLDEGMQGGAGEGGRAGQRPGKARDQETRVHATKARQGGMTKAVVPQEGGVRQAVTLTLGSYLSRRVQLGRQMEVARRSGSGADAAATGLTQAPTTAATTTPPSATTATAPCTTTAPTTTSTPTTTPPHPTAPPRLHYAPPPAPLRPPLPPLPPWRRCASH
ncbi:unnamed protein product [Closterium sp. NIES-64]|nr:unnamed protein product [Closterium sp. NIES-64]